MTENISQKSRIVGLDIIRSFAILFVISSHFFSIYTPFKTTIFEGVSMFIQATAVPLLSGIALFMILTGYLNANKTLSKGYYKGCIKVLFSYILFSIVTIIFRKYYLHESLSLGQWILKIFDFSAIPYAWYIEMWIGLFLLTPFLNYMYKALPGKKHKEVLIITLYVLTCVPLFVNRYNLHIVPEFWEQCYPLFFYFTGCYIREYKPKPNKAVLAAIILAICLINPVFNSLFIHDHTLIQISGDSYGAVRSLIAIAFFLMFYNVSICPKFINALVTKVSTVSLDMFMCCFILDKLIYPYFIDRYYISQSQFGKYFFIIVPLLFIGSFIIAFVKDKLCKLISPRL